MALTQLTLALSLAFASALVSVLVGAIGRRSFSSTTIIAALVFCLAVPIGFYLIYLNFESFTVVLDWPLSSGSFLALWNPFSAIMIASWVGGFLGIFSGRYWEEGDRSCLNCLLGPVILIFVVSIVIVALP